MDIEKDPRHPFRKRATVTETEIEESNSGYGLEPLAAQTSWHNGPVTPDLPKWEGKKAIERSTKSVVIGYLINFCYLLFPAVYIALGVLVLALSGRPISDGSPSILVKIEEIALYYGIQQAITVSVTLFPILFGIVVGAAIKTVTQYKAERGTTLLTLEQLVASKSFSSAALAPVTFKRINKLVIGLAALWLISPLTTQSLQRMFSYQMQTEKTMQKDVWYLNTLDSTPTTWTPDWTGGSLVTDDLFESQMILPDTQSPTDVYGNPRLPLFSDVQNNCIAEPNGYYPVGGVSLFGLVDLPDCKSSVPTQYSSYLGIPIAGLFENTSSYSTITQFKILTSSWTFSCSPWVQFSASEVTATYNTSSNSNWFKTNCPVNPSNFDDMECHPDNALMSFFFLTDKPVSKDEYPRLIFGSRNKETPARYGTIACDIQNLQIDTTIACAGKSCNVVGMKKASAQIPPFSHDIDDASSQTVISSVASHLASLETVPSLYEGDDFEPVGESSILERWMYNPANISGAATADTYANLSAISPQVFERRLAYLWNTMYLSGLDPEVFSMHEPFRFPDTTANTHQLAPEASLYKKTSAQVSELRLTYKARPAWVAMLFLSCVVVIGVIALNSYMQPRVLGPQIVGLVSSMTQNNPYVPLPPGGCNLGGMERTLMLADLKVRLQDVRPHQDVGHIALASVAGEPLKVGRTYA